MTYDELVTRIREWTEVDSTVFTSTIVNGFIENAEFRIKTDVDLDVFRRNDYSTLTSGNDSSTISSLGLSSISLSSHFIILY